MNDPKTYPGLIKKVLSSISLESLNTFITIIAASLAAYTGYQAHKVSTQVNLLESGIKKAGLVKDLIEILASSDKKMQKDIALIVLNRTISQDQETRLMTAEIAEQIYKDNHATAKAYAKEFDLNPENKGKTCRLAEITEFPASVVAFRVIEENNPDRAQVLLRELGREIKPSEGKSATTSSNSTSCIEVLVSHYSFFNKVTWLQFNKQGRQGDVMSFGTKLNDIGFNVPTRDSKVETELVDSGYTWRDDTEKVSSVRFYHPSDRPRAVRLQRLTERFFNQYVRLDDMSVRMPNKPFGQVEIWIHFKD